MAVTDAERLVDLRCSKMESYCFECFPIFHHKMANSLRSVLGFIDASDSESKLIFRIMQDLQGCHAFAPSKLSSMFQTNSHSSNLFGYNFEFQLLDTSNAHVEQFAFEVARFLNTIWKHFAIFYNCHLFFTIAIGICINFDWKLVGISPECFENAKINHFQ